MCGWFFLNLETGLYEWREPIDTNTTMSIQIISNYLVVTDNNADADDEWKYSLKTFLGKMEE